MKRSTKLCHDSRYLILEPDLRKSSIQYPAFILLLFLLFFSSLGQAQYKPTSENLKNREWFQDTRIIINTCTWMSFVKILH